MSFRPESNDRDCTQDWIAVVVLDGYSALSLGAIVEPFALFDQYCPIIAPKVKITGLLSTSVSSFSGVNVCCEMDGEALDEKVRNGPAPQAIIVCGPTLKYQDSSILISLLRRASRSGVAVFGVGNIVWSMAKAGLITNNLATLHWQSLAAFSEDCTPVESRNALFIAEKKGGTCPGELATLDLIMEMIAARAPKAADVISDHLLISQRRSGFTRQPGSQSERLRQAPPLIAQATRIMSENIEDPLSLFEIAQLCGCSLRQLERLFRSHLKTSPMRYYNTLKLERALELVGQTELPFSEVAIASGFSSRATFYRKFRQKYEYSPSEVRCGEMCLHSLYQS